MNPSQEGKQMHPRSWKLACQQSMNIWDVKKYLRPSSIILSYDVCEERVVFNLVSGDNETSDKFISVQVEDSDRIWSPLFRSTQNISQSTVHHPQAVAFVNSDSESADDCSIILLENVFALFSGFGISSSASIAVTFCCSMVVNRKLICFPGWVWVKDRRLFVADCDVVERAGDSTLPSELKIKSLALVCAPFHSMMSIQTRMEISWVSCSFVSSMMCHPIEVPTEWHRVTQSFYSSAQSDPHQTGLWLAIVLCNFGRGNSTELATLINIDQQKKLPTTKAANIGNFKWNQFHVQWYRFQTEFDCIWILQHFVCPTSFFKVSYEVFHLLEAKT